MLFKDPLKELWVPFGINVVAVLINLMAASFSIWTGGWLWIINVVAAGFSAWFSVKEFRKVPERKRRLQEELLGYLKGPRRDFG